MHHGFGIHGFGHWGSQHAMGLGFICGVNGDPNAPQVWDPSVWPLGTPMHHGFGIHPVGHRGPQHTMGLGSIGVTIGDPNAPRGRDPSVGS